eukprot:CAMPEP_0206231320 /NCGR_PEP_ID=MMETSP0047_2-20121206/10771_1 /ASSEMBLY_ACC=CAM_ASM_000192 /TAXON_ID=195065 /ORGANISM="Chroomonas mesostigmatica_cf, Strain CCMP1168" /LENGTH=335 /DNA_ID=CAMNT_0053654885 /DNA_START=278 /DNA_END=1285 /DNA_ORIENTATION=+
MNGSTDPFYRYTMPTMQIKVEGTTKMIKTVLTNVNEVCQAIGRPVDYLVTYLGQELSANSKIDKDNRAYVTGSMELPKIQEVVYKFIRETVTCEHCKNPETSVHIEGSKKRAILYLTCKGCGRRTDMDSAERFVKYMISHPPADADFGHAKTAAGAVGAALADATAADEERKKKKKDKGNDDDDDGEKKKKKKKKKDGENNEDSPDGDDEEKKEKKKKKKKKKEGEDNDVDSEDDGEKKKKKDKKKDKKKGDNGGDSWDDDWGDIDTSEEAVAARAAALAGGKDDVNEKLAAKMEKAAKLAEEGGKKSSSDDEPAPSGGGGGDDDDDDDLDIDDI